MSLNLPRKPATLSSTATPIPTMPRRTAPSRLRWGICVAALLLLVPTILLWSWPTNPFASLADAAAAPLAQITSSLGANATSSSGWRLVWSDEFTGTTLDRAKWQVASDASGGYTNCCLGYGLNAWNPADVTVANGALHLRSDAQPFASKAYSSGAVTTQGRFAFMYGRVDIRARLPRGAGLWPAFWLLPVTQSSWLASYEIDMMEEYGLTPGVAMTLHWTMHQAQCQLVGPNFSASYHVFSLVWTPTLLVWYVDGRPACMQTQHVPDVAMYLILNTALGGIAGQPTSATDLPQELTVDYVRVYQSASATAPSEHSAG